MLLVMDLGIPETWVPYKWVYGKHGLPYSRREATLFQGIRLFYNLILKSVILTDIAALFLC